MPGTLSVVATPLGNRGDLSPRAEEVLRNADKILAEDTRRAAQLLQWAGLPAKPRLSLHEHNETARVSEVLDLLQGGHHLALVSDAGTPLMADPGYRLVAACRSAGFRVIPVPGPCAPVTALMACGLPPYPFVFLGFLPRKSGQICEVLRPFSETQATLVFFERKNRVPQTLALAYEVFGVREFCLARELTKKHEEFIQGRLGTLPAGLDALLGEITVIIGPATEAAVTSTACIVALLQEVPVTLSVRDTVRVLQKKTNGWSSKALYDAILTFKKQK